MVGDFAIVVDDDKAPPEAFLLYSACITCYAAPKSPPSGSQWKRLCDAHCLRDDSISSSNARSGRYWDHVLTIDQLAPDFLSSAAATNRSLNSGLFTSDSGEAPAFFKRNGVFYALFDHPCGFCPSGSGAVVHTAPAALGPWTRRAQIDRAVPRSGQQNFVFQVGKPFQEDTDEWIWIGDQWHHSPDGTFGHSGQFWSPLQWDDSTSPPVPKPFEWLDNFSVTLPVQPMKPPSPPPAEYNDFHYPIEEPVEMANVSHPRACASVSGWQVVFSVPGALCVLEQSFRQFGVIALLNQSSSGVRLLRKSVGALEGITQPRRRFSAAYFQRMASSLSDAVAELALTADNAPGYPDLELSFGALAQQLAPPRDITEISLASDVVKFVVSHSGRIKCSKTDITDSLNLSAPVPSGQTVIFDPASHLQSARWPSYDFENMKSGLVGGHLRIANIGAYSRSSGGFELIALADASFHATAAGDSSSSPAAAHHTDDIADGVAAAASSRILNSTIQCTFTAAKNNTYIAGCPKPGCKGFHTLAEAEAGCQRVADCGGITFYPIHHLLPYQLRACGSATGVSAIGEHSYVITNAQACGRARSCAQAHALPRRAGINYSPAVFVRLREQAAAAAPPSDTQQRPSFRYWRANNSSGAVEVSAAAFYGNLETFLKFNDATFDRHAALLRLPGAEGRRQRDQSLSGLLLGANNYVGNQANYGDGIPYWSVARQDNGSLALIPTTVDDALLDYGLCDTALAHIGYWLDNYLTEDGQIRYFTWKGVVDGVGDIGRLASLYLKARRQCGDHDTHSWGDRYMPALLAIGRRILQLKAAGTDGRAASAQRGSPRPECKGLVAGCPEADWSHFAVHHSPDK
eukprot:COSAG01_NODE_2720_length_7187_cov_3.163516_4_plen_860_part_00